MPTTYAHYTFGREVFKHLDSEPKKIISENINLFNIGLHGPDILFYYEPLKSNPISQIGGEIHRKNADTFFEGARTVINKCSDPRPSCAYIMGFICHFMLDSECHPYIREKEINGFSHNEIETQFDRALIIKTGLNPTSYEPTLHIVPCMEYANCISMFFKGVSPEEILKILKSMKFYLNLLVAPGHIKRSVITFGLRLSGNYENLIGLLLNRKPKQNFTEINVKLQSLYENAIIVTSNIINEYYKNIFNNDPINARFHRNFE